MGRWVKIEWEQGKGSFAFLELKKGGAVFVRGAGATEVKKGATVGGGDDVCHNQPVHSAAAREWWRRINNKMAELSRLILSAARMNSTAEMLEAATATYGSTSSAPAAALSSISHRGPLLHFSQQRRLPSPPSCARKT
uniref:Uncharacterized protein n=1 Tax=Oryza punctata TaxID=4537 RepID=A0A0E0MCD9_ORYPU